EVFAVLPIASANFLPQSSDFLRDNQTLFMGWSITPGMCGNDYGFGWNGCLSAHFSGLEGFMWNSSLVDPIIEIAGNPPADASGLTLAISADDNDAGRAGNPQYVALWEARGGTVVYNETNVTPGGASDYTPFVQE